MRRVTSFTATWSIRAESIAPGAGKRCVSVPSYVGELRAVWVGGESEGKAAYARPVATEQAGRGAAYTANASR
jgi:hypothetical protein